MWIKSITLENFAGLKVGSGISKLSIDFTTRKNKLCLLLAPNGRGKSVLMSMLTPFASVGNLDVRDSTNLIIKGQRGYKEVVIV